MTLVLSSVIVAISCCLPVVIRNGGALSWYLVINWLPSLGKAARKDMGVCSHGLYIPRALGEGDHGPTLLVCYPKVLT